MIAQLTSVDGDLDRVVRAVKLNGFVNCTPDFVEQPHVINGASELMIEVFGENGRHALGGWGANLPSAWPLKSTVFLRWSRRTSWWQRGFNH